MRFFPMVQNIGLVGLDGKKVNDEFRRLDEENPFPASLSSSFERERQRHLERLDIKKVDPDSW